MIGQYQETDVSSQYLGGGTVGGKTPRVSDQTLRVWDAPQIIEKVQTDSTTVSFPYKIAPPSGIPNETSGGGSSICFFPLAEYSSLVKQAWSVTRQTENGQVAYEARKLLQTIQEIIDSLEQVGVGLGFLPPLQAFNVDDGSVLIEWIFKDFRMGFTVEPNPEDSGWYLVSNRNLGEIGASGYTSNVDTKKLILWLLIFQILKLV
jgi:hypothetical protein